MPLNDISPKPAVLVVYASTHGHTAKIAARVARVINDAGCRTDVRGAASARSLSPRPYDAVVLAASVHMGKHQKAMVEFAARHSTSLNDRPTVFLSVSLSAADDTEESRVTTREMTDAFLDQTGLIPQRVEPVAGCLQYREYDFMTRLLLRVITRKHPEAHDMSQDHDYTDWTRVDEVASEFALQVPGGPPGRLRTERGAVPA